MLRSEWREQGLATADTSIHLRIREAVRSTHWSARTKYYHYINDDQRVNDSTFNLITYLRPCYQPTYDERSQPKGTVQVEP